ncbi:replication protein RepA [Siccirubricoccus phaeus]|uniref:replication protein RepA n=1 Tax=Siccirubricoccus phaeus TaxID=2595053 RepID=UPI0011F0EF14|nr:replication protein RepA [Siccirubricoccus phaeus]
MALSDQRKWAGKVRGKRRTAGTWKPVGEMLPGLFDKMGAARPGQTLTLIKTRLIDTAGRVAEAEGDIAYQHSILCQTALPYRDPGPAIRDWERRQGSAALKINAGEAMDPETGEWVKLGLPWGPKARLILMHLNSEAIRTKSPVVDVGDSLTDFVNRIGLTTDGRTIRTIKDQVGALSAALIRMAFVGPKGAYQIDAKVVSGFDLWFPKDGRQRVLWPSTVQLSADYFASLQAHAVPLNEQAIAALSHSAMALDVYAWLAQRLHRIPAPGRQLVPWPVAKEQFGPDYKSLRKFRQVFMTALKQACIVYPAAKIDVTGAGLFLYASAPPVPKTRISLGGPSR